jgi:hypothetical protein
MDGHPKRSSILQRLTQGARLDRAVFKDISVSFGRM